MRRREWLAVAAGAATACAPKVSPRGETTLRVGVVRPSQSSGPLQLAIEQGYFRKEGLKLELEAATVTGLHVGALAAGKLDACLVAMSPAIVNAAVQGAPIRLVMARQNVNSVCGAWGQFLGRKAAFPGQLKNFQELKGKNLAYSTPGSYSDFAVDAVLDSVGLTRKDVNVIAIKRQESVAALLAGSVDAIMQSVGTKEIPLERRGEFMLYPGAELIYPKAHILFVVFGEKLRGPQRQNGLGFLRAFRRGNSEFFSGKFPEFQKKWAEEMGEPGTSYPNCPQEAASGGAVDPANVKLYLDWALRRKIIDSPVAPESLIDATLLDELQAKAGA